MMIIRLIIHLAILGLLVTGCSKRDQLFVTENTIFSTALQNTKKSDILEDSKIKVVFIGTYLNYTDDIYDDENHNFLVSVYIPDVYFAELISTYGVYIYDIEQEVDIKLELHEFTSDELIAKGIPLYNKWAKYYMIKIPKSDQSNIRLKLMVENIGSTSLNFGVKN